jgi:hypothetical protein
MFIYSSVCMPFHLCQADRPHIFGMTASPVNMKTTDNPDVLHKKLEELEASLDAKASSLPWFPAIGIQAVGHLGYQVIGCWSMHASCHSPGDSKRVEGGLFFSIKTLKNCRLWYLKQVFLGSCSAVEHGWAPIVAVQVVTVKNRQMIEEAAPSPESYACHFAPATDNVTIAAYVGTSASLVACTGCCKQRIRLHAPLSCYGVGEAACGLMTSQGSNSARTLVGLQDRPALD